MGKGGFPFAKKSFESSKLDQDKGFKEGSKKDLKIDAKQARGMKGK